MGGDCSLGNEQAACDLLVAEAFRDQTRNLELPLREGSGVCPRTSNVLDLLGFTERQSHCRVAVQAFPRLKLRLELRCSEDSRRRLSGLGLEWRMRSNDLGAGTSANRLCCSKQPSAEARLAGTCGKPAHRRQDVELCYPVIDLPGDPEGFPRSHVCCVEVAVSSRR